MDAHELPEVMDRTQCAAYLNVGTSTVERWRRTEGLPYAKVGALVRYRRAAVDAWLAERETSHTTPAAVATVAVRRRPRRHP